MSYSDFTLDALKQKFSLQFIEDINLFPKVSDYNIPKELQTLLPRFIPLALAIDTEKARSEFIVAPLLAELKISSQKISLFSGTEFNVNKALGLSGRCDFIISATKEQYSLNAPIIMMVEAKNDNIKSGIAQCGAEMVAAQQFNLEKENNITIIYGCVTTGSNWKFLKLVDKTFYIDTIEYYIDNTAKIMGILNQICLSYIEKT